MKAVTVIENALVELFARLDAERFDEVAERLDSNVELADELIGEWLRGRERVAAYLRAQEDIITDVASEVSAVASCWLSSELGLVTFVARQRYRLDGAPRRETLTGSAIFAFGSGEPKLRLFHLGEASEAHDENIEGAEGAADAVEPPLHGRALAGAPGVGETLRALRGERGLSLRALASRSGLSPSFLSQVERGLTDPSISSLRRLAEALDATMLALLGEPADAPGGERIVRRQLRRRVAMPDSGLVNELLSSEHARRLDVRIATLEPGAATAATSRSHPGEEFLLVVEGQLALTVDGEELDLYAGDAITLDATVPHRLAAGPAPVRFLSVVTPSPS